MSSIRTSIQVQDGFSNALRSMNAALNSCISSFESVQRVANNGVDSGQFSFARAELNKVGASLAKVEEDIMRANQSQQQFNTTMQNTNSIADKLSGKIQTIAMGIASAVGLSKIVNLSDTYALTSARLDLMNDNLQTTEQLQEMIFQSAQRARGSYQTTADAVAKLGMQAKGAFSNTSEIVSFAEQLNKTFVNAGTSAIGVDSVMLQLTQSMAAGKLQGEELNAILDNAQPIVANIQNYLQKVVGMPKSVTDNIKQLASDGAISAEIIKNAMFYAADETNRKFETMPKTFGQIWTDIENQSLKAFQPVLKQINNIANSNNFAGLVNGIINSLSSLANIATKAFNEVVYISGVLSSNWSLIEPIVWGVVGAYVAYNGVAGITNGITAIKTGLNWLLTESTVAQTYATIMAIYAQEGFNAALYACPLTWILIAVIAVIAVFYLAIAAINRFVGTSLSATGMICGAFLVAGAFLGNIVIAFANLVIDSFCFIWNSVASFAEFFANVFTDPVNSIMRLFGDLGDGILTILSNIANAIDTLFGSHLSSAVESWRSGLKGIVNNKWGEAAIKIQRADPNALHLDRIDYGDSYNLGYNAGEAFSNNFGFNTQPTNIPNNFNNGPIASNIADTAKNTGAMKNSLDVSSEDLKYLRDIAEQEVINRFTTAEIKIDMVNNNTVNNEMDVDGIVEHIKGGLIESVQIAAEKVHK